MSLRLTPHQCTQPSILQVLSNPTAEAADVWLRDCRQSFSIMIREKQTRDAAAAKKEVSSSLVVTFSFTGGLQQKCSLPAAGISLCASSPLALQGGEGLPELHLTCTACDLVMKLREVSLSVVAQEKADDVLEAAPLA